MANVWSHSFRSWVSTALRLSALLLGAACTSQGASVASTGGHASGGTLGKGVGGAGGMGASGGAGGIAVDPSTAPLGEVVGTVVNDHLTYRTQIADIVPLGADAFAVGFRDATDHLEYAYWDGRGRQGPAEVAADEVPWMRSDSSRPREAVDSRCGSAGRAWIDTMAIETGINTTAKVRLDVHTNCGDQMSFTSYDIGEGARPASATTGSFDLGTAKTLVVYGRLDHLWGRFVHRAADRSEMGTIGDEFAIAKFEKGAVFSVDVFYNQHSERFIIGYIERAAMYCTEWNVAIGDSSFPPSILSGPTQFGVCDGDVGGHHTSSAYSPDGDGSYVWWRQDMDKIKRVFRHDRLGGLMSPLGLSTAEQAPNAESLGVRGNIWTAPVTASVDGDASYYSIFGIPDLHLAKVGDDRTWVDAVPNFARPYQVALRAFPGKIVALVRIADGEIFTGTATLRLVVAPTGTGAK